VVLTTISLNLKLKSIRIIWLTNTNISRSDVSIITHTDHLWKANGDKIVNFYELFCSMYGRQLGTKLWGELVKHHKPKSKTQIH
jgi:hypothetical protein